MPVTVVEKVHDPLAAMVAPVRVTLVEEAVIVPPPQVPITPLADSPAGSVSVNATPLSATVVFGFVIVNDSDVVPFNAIVDAPKLLVIDGGAPTVIIAVFDVEPVPPSVELTFPVVLL